MGFEALVGRLREASNFVEVSLAVRERALDLLDCEIACCSLFATEHQLAMLVDDTQESYADHELRLRYVESLPHDPQLAAMIERHCPIGGEPFAERMVAMAREYGYSGPGLCPRIVPLTGTDGLLGFLRFVTRTPMTRAIERDLDVLGTYSSAHLVRLGVAVRADVWLELSAREREIAELAGRGLTNGEIAELAQISVDTVKKHLKQVFLRLQIANRAELAALLVRVAPLDGLGPGVTRVENCWVTKSRHLPSSVSAR